MSEKEIADLIDKSLDVNEFSAVIPGWRLNEMVGFDRWDPKTFYVITSSKIFEYKNQD